MIVPQGIKEELRWFYEARFGMFVHFGLYSLLGRGEWAMYHDKIPRDEYSRLMHDFNPTLFAAEEWVQLAQEAGARYITVTTKHHDGFCLFDSALTDFKITNTPFKRDLIGELISACQNNDMRIILYYSQPDWHHPNYVHQPGAFKDLLETPETDDPDWPAYQQYYIGQVEELCRNYGPIDGIWFDGSHKTVDEWKGKEVYALIKQYQPHAVVNDRARYGDFFTPERTLPDDLTGYLFEACESVSPLAWGFRQNSPSYTTPHLIRSMVKMASSGGNYLLNVGPQPDGKIPPRQIQVLHEIGDWLRVNGQSIFQTDPVRLSAPQVRRRMVGESDKKNETLSNEIVTDDLSSFADKYGATLHEKNIYFHCMDWPEVDRFIIPGIRSKVRKIRLLGSSLNINFNQGDRGVELIHIPTMPPDPRVQVFELQCDEKPVIQEIKKRKQERESSLIRLNKIGQTTLPADQAQLFGRAVKGSKLIIERDQEYMTSVISGWMVPEQEAQWNIECQEAGDWNVTLCGICPVTTEQAIVQITIEDQTLVGELPHQSLPDHQINQMYPQASGFPKVMVGHIHIPVGRTVLTVKPKKLAWGYVLGKVEKILLDRIG